MNKITKSWTYNHKMLIVTLGLVTAHLIPLIPVPQWAIAETVTYTPTVATTTAIYSIEDDIEKRTIELYEKNKKIDLEQYRLKAITQVSEELQARVYVSPYVDYKAINEELKALKEETN